MAEAPAGTLPDIPVFDLRIEQEDLDAVAETLRSGWWSMGPRVAEFEQAFAEHLGCSHVVALSSCTAALHLALLAAGVGPGDEVVVPSFTFVATAAAVMHCGATPVFADIVGQHDLGIDPESVERLCGKRTKAVIPVHYAGYPAAIDRLAAICEDRGVALVEDCAHAPAGALGGRPLGTLGVAGCFSFFSNKVLTVGEGGALATDSDAVAERARLLRSQAMTAGTMDRHLGRATGYDVVALGFNYRIDEPRAALLRSRLPRVAAEVDRRRRLVRDYRARLAGVGGLEIPYTDADVDDSACYMMVVVLEEGRQADVRAVLRERGIQTTVMYPPIHRFSAYRERFPGVSLPRTELAARTQLTLPLYPHMTESELSRVGDAVEEALA